MKNFLEILNIIEYGTTVLVIIAAIKGFCRWIAGISPALWRLGKGLADRKIAVFANGDDFQSLKNLLVDSKLFKERNIEQITRNEVKKAEKYSLFLAHWKSIASYLDAILSEKKDDTALLVYAPQEEGPVPQGDIVKINQHRNVVYSEF